MFTCLHSVRAGADDENLSSRRSPHVISDRQQGLHRQNPELHQPHAGRVPQAVYREREGEESGLSALKQRKRNKTTFFYRLLSNLLSFLYSSMHFKPVLTLFLLLLLRFNNVSAHNIRGSLGKLYSVGLLALDSCGTARDQTRET